MHPAIPFLALQAEAKALPFATAAPACQQLTKLSRSAPGVPSGQTRALSAELDSILTPRSAGMSLDGLRNLRDYVWFPDVPVGATDDPSFAARTIPLADYASHLAATYLEYAGDRVRLRFDENPAQHAQHWRWLTLYLPQDFLIAARVAPLGSAEPPSDHVQLVSHQLAQVLGRGCAETHLHLGASVPFDYIWAALMRALAVDGTFSLARLKPPILKGSVKQLELWLQAAAISRLILARFVLRQEAQTWTKPFSEFVSSVENSPLRRMCRQLPAPPRFSTQEKLDPPDVFWGLCTAALTFPDHQQVTPIFGLRSRWQSLYRRLLGMHVPGLKPPAHDPLEALLHPQSGVASAETRFVCRGLRYCQSLHGRSDSLFARRFFQYLRFRIQLYRDLIQAPGTAGLDWFSRFQRRVSPLRSPLDNRLLEIAMKVESQDLCLQSIELRQTPETSWPQVRKQVRDIARAAHKFLPAEPVLRPEVGLVLHFVKERLRTESSLHADPGTILYGSRHGTWFAQRKSEASAIAAALRNQPELLLVLRGLDVANTELSQPTWVLLPLWQRVRSEAKRAAAYLAVHRPRWQVPTLRTTVHAGEDFVRLVEGLRRIHEAVESGLVRLGDRLGHALALGRAPAQWAKENPYTAQPIEDRLDDLLWELERYQKGQLATTQSRCEFVRAEICRLARVQYGADSGTPEDHIIARTLRWNQNELRRIGYPRCNANINRYYPNSNAQRIWQRYLCDRGAFVRGQQAIPISCEPAEVAVLETMQKGLRAEIGNPEITVESNPSSNLVIGGFDSIHSLPTFRFQPLPGNVEPLGGPVLVSVNTDNPITFSSCLADEFAYVYYGLLNNGVHAADALAWLDRVRSAGTNSRFTLPASTTLEALSALLKH